MKKLLVLVLAIAVGIALSRRLSSAGALPAHRHGTPDHWPPVVRKPGSKAAPAA